MILNPSDFKNYIYCPRQVFFKYVVPLSPVETEKMHYGSKMQKIFSLLEKRRKIDKYGFREGKRIFSVKFYSEFEQLSGICDMLIETEKEVIPVEIKLNEPYNSEGYELQLLAYSKGLSDKFKKASNFGYIYYLSKNRLEMIEYDNDLKYRFEQIRKEIEFMVETEKMPEAAENEKCLECEYINFCGDVR